MMELLSIGKFAKPSHLSPKALRLYDKMGRLVPRPVDPDSGYRLYGVEQIETARLVSSLRRIQVPPGEIQRIIALDPPEAAARLSQYWAAVEDSHIARRDLATFLINQLNGRYEMMYEVDTREIPSREILCVKRRVNGMNGAWAFGQEFIGMIKTVPYRV